MKTALWKYLAALPIVLIALILGNLAGTIFGSISGWSNLEMGKPGGVVLSIFQSVAGVWFALAATDKFLKSTRVAHFWLIALVAFLGLAVVVFGGLLIARSDFAAFDWRFLAGVVGLIATEVTRRVAKDEFALDQRELADQAKIFD